MVIANPRSAAHEAPLGAREDASDSIPEGTEIAGRYRILGLIGEGGMGTVYRAEHLFIHKVFALKVLHARLVGQPHMAARFEREAVAAARIEHPNVVPARDFGRLPDGTFFLVLEFVNGRSLASEVKAGAIETKRALSIMRGVVAGVRAAHERGIIHRDLKPENIMLVDRYGTPDFVKLLDFGIARIDSAEKNQTQVEQRLTVAGTMLGTPEYMSPEQIIGRPVDARSDLYSLGVIFFQILTGRCPFAGNVATVLQQHIAAETPELTPAVVSENPRLAQIVRMLLAKSPDNRFQSARELAAALDEVAATKHHQASRVEKVVPAHTRFARLRTGVSTAHGFALSVLTSLAKLSAPTNALVSRGLWHVRASLRRLLERRRPKPYRVGEQRRVPVPAIVARGLDGLRRSASALGSSARAFLSKTVAYLGNPLRLYARPWRLAVCCVAMLTLIILVVVATQERDGVARAGVRGVDARPTAAHAPRGRRAPAP